MGEGEGVPVFWNTDDLGFLSMKIEDVRKITGVKTDDVKIDSLMMWRSKKLKIKCEDNPFKCKDSEADIDW